MDNAVSLMKDLENIPPGLALLESTGKHREAQGSTGKHWEAQGSTGKHWEAQGSTGKHLM